MIHRFDRELMRFHEVGFIGIDHQIIWEVNDAIYMEKERRIYIFGMSDSEPSFHRMWYSDIYYINIDDKQLKWRKLKMTLPYYTYGVFADYCVVMGYDHILFMFYYELKELWIFDMIWNQRWKSKHCIDIELSEFCQFIMSDDDMVHCVCLDENGPIHTKLALNELLKEELEEHYNKLQADLVCGYIKRTFRDYVPLSCKTLIFKYYPSIINV